MDSEQNPETINVATGGDEMTNRQTNDSLTPGGICSSGCNGSFAQTMTVSTPLTVDSCTMGSQSCPVTMAGPVLMTNAPTNEWWNPQMYGTGCGIPLASGADSTYGYVPPPASFPNVYRPNLVNRGPTMILPDGSRMPQMTVGQNESNRQPFRTFVHDITRSAHLAPTDSNMTHGSEANQSGSRYERLQNKIAIERFDPTSSLPAEMWLVCFEQVTDGCNDSQRIALLLSYVAKDAFRWYAQFVSPFRAAYDWPMVKRMFLDKFARPQMNPGIAAARRRLTAKDTIQSYFEQQTRDMEMAQFSESTMIEFLTNGLPDGYRQVLYAREPRSLNEWLRCAQGYERSRHMESGMTTIKAIDAPSALRQTRDASKQDVPPPGPCPGCKRNGRTENNLHWYRVCPYRKDDPESKRGNDNKTAAGHLNSRGGPHTA